MASKENCSEHSSKPPCDKAYNKDICQIKEPCDRFSTTCAKHQAESDLNKNEEATPEVCRKTGEQIITIDAEEQYFDM